jgi:hypothetical protein
VGAWWSSDPRALPFFYALFVHCKGWLILVLRDYFNNAFRTGAVEWFSAPLFFFFFFFFFPSIIVLFCCIKYLEIKKLIIISGFGGLAFGNGAPRPEMFVAFAHVAVTEFAGLAQHFINYFVKAVNVTRECVAILHMAEVERKRFKIIAQVNAAVFARQNVLQTENEIAVLVLLLRGGGDRIVEAHRVEEMPHSRPPHTGEHAVSAGIIPSFERSISGFEQPKPFF